MFFFQESLDIFQAIVNSSCFAEVSIILFLNKTDLLKEKVSQGVCIGDYFPDFQGDNLCLTDVQRFLVNK